MENKLPADIMEQIELKAVHEAALQFHPVYSPDQNTACRICYRNGAKEYATWKLKHDELVQENERLKRWKAEALTLLSQVDAYADKHAEIKLGQGKVEFTIARAKERDEFKWENDRLKIALENVYKIHSDQWTEYDRKVIKDLIKKEGETNTPAPGEGKEVKNG
jgi:hypothetical protein